MVAPIRSERHCVAIVARDLILHSIEYELKQIPTRCSDDRGLGEIRWYQSPLLEDFSVLSVNSANINTIQMSNGNVLYELTNGIPQIPCLSSMGIAVSSTVEFVNLTTSDLVNLFSIAM
jgi:hypothetical protein